MGTDRNEFDGINLKEEYTKELEKLGISIPLYIANDGNSMLSGILNTIQLSDPKLKDRP